MSPSRTHSHLCTLYQINHPCKRSVQPYFVACGSCCELVRHRGVGVHAKTQHHQLWHGKKLLANPQTAPSLTYFCTSHRFPPCWHRSECSAAIYATPRLNSELFPASDG